MKTNIVKSGARSLEVMGFFADCREANLMQVARALDYPQSSTSQLLQSLAALGYLRYDARRRTFSAGARAALLGANLSARVFGASDIGALVDAAARAADRDVHVCEVVDDKVHDLVASAWRVDVRPPMPLADSAAGLLFLSALSDAEAVRLVAPEEGCKIMLNGFGERLARVRRDGHALRNDSAGAELAIPLNRQPRLALTFRGPRFGGEEQAAALARRARAIVCQWRPPEARRRDAPCYA